MYRLLAAAAVPALLAAAPGPGPAPKPQPGSWSMRMEVIDVKGANAPQIRAAMTKAFAAMASRSVCITPAASAASDPAKGLGVDNGTCSFSRRDISAAGIHLAGACSKNGARSRITADGSITATSQDMVMVTQASGPRGAGPMTMTVRVRARRTGACKPGDMMPPRTPRPR